MTDEQQQLSEQAFEGFPRFPVKVGEEPIPACYDSRTFVKTYYFAEPEEYEAYLRAIEEAGFTLTDRVDDPGKRIRYYAVFKRDKRSFALHYSLTGKRIAVLASFTLFDRPWTRKEALQCLPDPVNAVLTNPNQPDRTASKEEAAASTGEGNYTLFYEETPFETYASYQEAMIRNGYRKTYENREGIEGNVFLTRFDKDASGFTFADPAACPKTSVVYATYFKRLKRMTVTAGFDTELSPHLFNTPDLREGEIPGKKNTLHMIQLFTTGNSFVFQLKNGHFLISDGGIWHDVKYLLDYLDELAPAGEKPVVEQWLITHPHGDHTTCLEAIAGEPELAERLYVDGFYYSIPSDLVFMLDPGCREDCRRMNNSLALLKTSKGEPTPTYRLHTGERFYFDDVTVDIAVESADVPFPTYTGDINDSSNWSLYTVEGQRLLLGGDGDMGGFDLLKTAYTPEYCNLDFFSVIHHGHNVTKEVAEYVNPVTCICPAPDEGPDYRREWTHLLKRKSAEYVTFEEGTQVFEFPYTVGTYRTIVHKTWKYHPEGRTYIPAIFSPKGKGIIIWKGRWICPPEGFGDRTPVFVKKLPKDDRAITGIKLYITAMGVYEAKLNGQRVGDFIMAPGWTSYERIQYQEYDILPLYKAGEENTIEVTVGNGWYGSTLMYTTNRRKENAIATQEPYLKLPRGLLVQVRYQFADGHTEYVSTDESWEVYDGPVRMNGIYEGEVYDANVPLLYAGQARKFMGGGSAVVEQEGEIVREHEVLPGVKCFRTPKGEVVIDFGQEVTGYIRTTIEEAHKGDVVDLSFAETLDKDGNFYNDNYRGARCFYRYICKDGAQVYKPSLTFYGFRYIRVNEFPGGKSKASEKNFEAIAVYSDVKQTGFLKSSSPLLNQLFSNFIWGEKDNFLDVPTDCPQRDERLGWTGDVTAVCRAACLNFDMDKFFSKWLHDLAWDQKANGLVDAVIPAQSERPTASAMWGDVTTILPWQLYLSYGDKEILEHQYPSMKLWVKYITDTTTTPYLWTGPHRHYGDWLGLDAPSGSYKGSSREWFIASAFYARSTELVIKAGRVLGEDVSYYEDLYEKIVKTFRETYPTYETQTECVLAAYFNLAPEPQKAADQLAGMVKEAGHLTTGFVGTPYLLHALSDYGYPEIAYDLLLREEYPGWLYAVKRGATTVWEHWDSIMEDGSFWSTAMNSLNHYAYSSVADWVYMTALGIRTKEEAPGYEKVEIAPIPTDRLDFMEATLDTRHGRIVSKWEKAEGGFLYDITVPVEATIKAGGKSITVPAGRYIFKNEPDYNAKRAGE